MYGILNYLEFPCHKRPSLELKEYGINWHDSFFKFNLRLDQRGWFDLLHKSSSSLKPSYSLSREGSPRPHLWSKPSLTERFWLKAQLTIFKLISYCWLNCLFIYYRFDSFFFFVTLLLLF